MAFYTYVIFDGYRYKTLAKQWRPATIRVATPRMTLFGNLEATFGSGSLRRWDGLVIAPHGEAAPGAADGALDGNIFTLRASLEKRALLNFKDHTGNSYQVVAVGPFVETMSINIWNSPSNKYYIQVQFTAREDE
jgi:hypothetical protein